jgi:hypothetical protein
VGLKFHTIRVPSKEELTTCFRLGLKASPVIVSLWPLKDLLRAGSPTEAKNLGLPGPPALAGFYMVEREGFEADRVLFIFEF